MAFKDSKTYQNLLSAYQADLASSTEYDIYAIAAKQEGYINFSNIFTTFSGNQLEHGRIWLRQLNGGSIPATTDNIKTALKDTKSQIYRDYAKVAKQEGYNDIAALFNGVANIEMNHDLTLDTMLYEIQTDKVFCKDTEILWICLSCGNIMSGLCAPKICPVCSFPQGFYTPYNPVENI